MSNSLNQNPQIINTAMSAVQNVGAGNPIRLIWVWGAATDTFTLLDALGNTVLVGIGTTGQTTGMQQFGPFQLEGGGYKVSAITVSGTGALYVLEN